MEGTATLRPAALKSGVAVTADHERYFAVRELAAEIATGFDRLEERTDSKRQPYFETRQPEAVGRRSRYRAVKRHSFGSSYTNYHQDQPFRSLLSADGMEEVLRELLDETEPIDPDQDLFDLENRLALLKLLADAQPEDRPTYLWIRGFPCGGSNEPTRTVAAVCRTGWQDGLGVETNFVCRSDLPKSDVLIEVKGLHARPLARTEVGTHLVLPKHGGPIPVRVEVIDRWPVELTDLALVRSGPPRLSGTPSDLGRPHRTRGLTSL